MTVALCFFLMLLCGQAASAQSATNELLTNAIDVLSLPGDSAWGKAVVIRGVVTAAEPVSAAYPNWEGRFFVQDETAGIFAEDSSHRRPEPGDYVEVAGTTHPGGFAPFVSYARWKKLGTAPLPSARLVPIEQVMAGTEDGQRIEISGVIRAIRVEKPVVVYEIASGGYRLSVYAPSLTNIDSQASLIGAQVRARGTASTFFSGQLRQLITVELHVPFASDFVVENARRGDPFLAPILPLNSLGQYRRTRELGERVHVKGVVTCQRPGEDFFLRDSTSGLQVKSRQAAALSPGDVVEAVGFPAFDDFLPVLEDATFRKTDEPRETVEPKMTTLQELHAGYRHADLIRLQGKVLEHAERLVADRDGGKGEQQTMLTLQNAGVAFTVEGFAPGPNKALSQIAVGSTVEVDGIAFMHITGDGKLQSLQMLLPGAGNIRVLQKPDWLTPERLLAGLGMLFTVLVVALTWIVMVQRRNQALKVSIQDKTRAQQELQQSHDLLEWRVEERTKQLKVEMTARKEAEVQFRATLAERTRLAQELHDTLEQSLTGIGLQLDAAVTMFEEKAEGATHHLEVARNLMTQSQLELRRSIWDLRSRELEEFDFPNALRMSARRIVEGTDTELEVEINGKPRVLSEIVEENLLRITQEAITNVVKHAGATHVKLTIEFMPQAVTLQVKDDGSGFIPEHARGSSEGHFGLLGMFERAKRLNGRLDVTSSPGDGTCLKVEIPIKLEEEIDKPVGDYQHGMI